MDGQEQPQKKGRISKDEGRKLIAVAILFDVISIIPVYGQAIAIVGSGVVFTLWFMWLGVPLLNTKVLIRRITSYIPEAIPLISALPAISFGIFLTIGAVQLEDRVGLPVTKLAEVPKPKVSAASSAAKTAVPQPRMNDILPSTA